MELLTQLDKDFIIAVEDAIYDKISFSTVKEIMATKIEIPKVPFGAKYKELKKWINETREILSEPYKALMRVCNGYYDDQSNMSVPVQTLYHMIRSNVSSFMVMQDLDKIKYLTISAHSLIEASTYLIFISSMCATLANLENDSIVNDMNEMSYNDFKYAFLSHCKDLYFARELGLRVISGKNVRMIDVIRRKLTADNLNEMGYENYDYNLDSLINEPALLLDLLYGIMITFVPPFDIELIDKFLNTMKNDEEYKNDIDGVVRHYNIEYNNMLKARDMLLDFAEILTDESSDNLDDAKMAIIDNDKIINYLNSEELQAEIPVTKLIADIETLIVGIFLNYIDILSMMDFKDSPGTFMIIPNKLDDGKSILDATKEDVSKYIFSKKKRKYKSTITQKEFNSISDKLFKRMQTAFINRPDLEHLLYVVTTVEMGFYFDLFGVGHISTCIKGAENINILDHDTIMLAFPNLNREDGNNDALNYIVYDCTKEADLSTMKEVPVVKDGNTLLDDIMTECKIIDQSNPPVIVIDELQGKLLEVIIRDNKLNKKDSNVEEFEKYAIIRKVKNDEPLHNILTDKKYRIYKSFEEYKEATSIYK